MRRTPSSVPLFAAAPTVAVAEAYLVAVLRCRGHTVYGNEHLRSVREANLRLCRSEGGRFPNQSLYRQNPSSPPHPHRSRLHSPPLFDHRQAFRPS
ncbi:hypothetical protein VNO78_30436 [Psophocarpus tetragonolobus]|uniref:Uncharacterized protein n=1 Tax=Psophocarpus tetragonolobus TaxID=3891 RepID=A0AAN9X568_PSOTE